MANKGAKKRKEENERHMHNLRLLIAISNAIYVLVRIGYFRSSVSWRHYLGLLITSGVYKFTYGQIAGMAKPAYDDNGELFHGGSDMRNGGICGYLHDAMYITSFIQISSLISDKFWYVYLAIPLFGLYKLWETQLIQSFFQSQKEIPEDEKSRRKREKLERKAARPKFTKTRAR